MRWLLSSRAGRDLAQHPLAGCDLHSELADGQAVARRRSARERHQPLLDREIALHPEAEAVAAGDLVDGHRADRFGHRAGKAAGSGLADFPAPLAGWPAVVDDPLDEQHAAVGLEAAMADTARDERLAEQDADRPRPLGAAFEELHWAAR